MCCFNSSNRPDREGTTKIFVGNIKEGTTNEELQALFEQYGKVTEADVCSGFGFVVSYRVFSSPAVVSKPISVTSGCVWCDHLQNSWTRIDEECTKTFLELCGAEC